MDDTVNGATTTLVEAIRSRLAHRVKNWDACGWTLTDVRVGDIAALLAEIDRLTTLSAKG
jgi:hypothetical protein